MSHCGKCPRSPFQPYKYARRELIIHTTSEPLTATGVENTDLKMNYLIIKNIMLLLCIAAARGLPTLLVTNAVSAIEGSNSDAVHSDSAVLDRALPADYVSGMAIRLVVTLCSALASLVLQVLSPVLDPFDKIDPIKFFDSAEFVIRVYLL